MSFESATARDLNVLIHKESGFINYTKLCKDLSGGKRQAFRNVVEKNPCFQKLVLSMEYDVGALAPTSEKDGFDAGNDVSSTGDTSESDRFNIEFLISNGVLLLFGEGVPKVYSGTYGPRYMLDYLISHFKPEYCKLIHKALETVDKLAQIQEFSFEKKMKQITEENEREIERLTSENNGLKHENSELKEQMDFLINKVIAADYKLDELMENDRQILDRILDVHREVGSIPVKMKRMGYE